ncbi:DUF5677 domain-containing protein [Lederbergia citrea]|uniref:Uncharacterized protein n=1 Tax=Lederbergia citrea TaxID=2833581 RepID=A0A942UI37_9BACI|nr:DUF5677 domain-containing protein [Lederbergia citrea]MBS4221875.1 hypothetical protein [Lederbergia citrea]
MVNNIGSYISECDSIGKILEKQIDIKRTSSELTELEKVLLRLFERLYGNYAGALELYTKNLYVQVGTLTRSIFEDYLNIFYIQHAPQENREKLAERYLDYAGLIEPYNHYKSVEKLATELGDLSLLSKVYSTVKIKELEDNKEEFIRKYNGNIRSWSGLNFSELSLKAGERDKYFRYYNRLSCVTHGAPLGNFTKKEISITIFLSLTSFVALADLIGENELAIKANKVKDNLLAETDVVL